MINHNIKNYEEDSELAAHVTWFHGQVYGLQEYDLFSCMQPHIQGELATFCLNELELRADITQSSVNDTIEKALAFNKYNDDQP
jgi:hypothetical protein